MGEMSAIVSERPSVMNQSKEAFWISIRLGRSRTYFRREKLFRARREATLLVKNRDLRSTQGRTTSTETAWRAETCTVADKAAHPQANACGKPPSWPRTIACLSRKSQRRGCPRLWCPGEACLAPA